MRHRIYINISKLSIITIILLGIGVAYCYRGINYHKEYNNIISELEPFHISQGQYLKLQIDSDDIMGRMIEGKFAPLYRNVSFANDHRYMIGTEDKSYYVALIVPRAYQKDFTDFLESKSGYHFTGRVEELNSKLDYEGIISCLNIKRENIEKVVETGYLIRIINIENEEKKIFMGICIFAASIILFGISSIKFERREII